MCGRVRDVRVPLRRGAARLQGGRARESAGARECGRSGARVVRTFCTFFHAGFRGSGRTLRNFATFCVLFNNIAKLILEKVLSESEYQAVRKGAYLVDLEEAVTMQWSARQVFQPLYGSTPALGSST